MPTPIWRGKVKGGRIHIDRRTEFDAYAGTLDGKCVELVLRPETKPKSGNARRYLHGVVLKTFARESGRSLAEMKAILKLKLLWDGETVDEAGLPVIPSTEELDSKEYAEFTDDCRRLAAECRIVIPGPGEVE